jgi:hypothetical protein
MATTLDIATPIFPVAGVVAVVEDHLSNSLHLVMTLPNTQLVKYVTNKAAQQPHVGSVLSKAIRLTPLRYSANVHLTNDLSNLNMHAEDYTGMDQIRVGNGQGLNILHSGRSILPTSSHNIHLFSLLHVPQIQKKILYLSINSLVTIKFSLNFI